MIDIFTIRIIAEEININRETVWLILMIHFDMKKGRMKLVSKKLTNDWLKWRKDVCADFSTDLGDWWLAESLGWKFGFQYDPDTK
jgi:hypothetical protein